MRVSFQFFIENKDMFAANNRALKHTINGQVYIGHRKYSND